MTHTEEHPQRTEHRRGSAALRRQAEALQAAERPHLDAAQRQFIEAMRARGLTLPGGRLIADGRVHRCDVAGNGKAGRGDGSYVLHLDGRSPAGCFSNWTDGRGAEDWCYDPGGQLSEAEQREADRALQVARSEHDKHVQAASARARMKARRLWCGAGTAQASHAYCRRKQVEPYELRCKYGSLLVPMLDPDEHLVNLQFIRTTGDKTFLKGGRLTGCHFWVAAPDDERSTIVLCEGWATGESIFQATGHAVCTAFCGWNLLPVAQWLRERYPQHRIIVAADDDWRTDGNPGLTQAHEAARAVNGLRGVPLFGDDRRDDETDFNDMLVAYGADEVHRAFDAAAEPDQFDQQDAADGDERWLDELVALRDDPIKFAVRCKVEAKRHHVNVNDIKAAVKAHSRRRPRPPEIEYDFNALARSAREIIACENVLSLFAAQFRRMVAGEEKTAKLLYVVATSRLLNTTMHAAIKGPSAGGKSMLRSRVLDYVPPEDVISFTALSEKALLYMEEDFAHKLLSMGEAVATEEQRFQDYLLRELMSEGKLRYQVSQKSEDGTIATRIIEKNGPVAFLVTTTRNNLNPENETRMLSLEITDSEEQTKSVLRKIAAVEGFNREVGGGDLRNWHDYQRWLAAGERRVVIPFAKELAELIPARSVRLRRDFSQLLRSVKVCALLHRHHRKRDKHGQILATIREDYADARALLADLLAESSELKTNKTIRATLAAVVEAQQPEAEGTSAPLRAIADHLNLDTSAVWRRLQAAEAVGLIENLETRRGRPGRYGLTRVRPSRSDDEMLPAVEALDQRWRASVAARRQTRRPGG